MSVTGLASSSQTGKPWHSTAQVFYVFPHLRFAVEGRAEIQGQEFETWQQQVKYREKVESVNGAGRFSFQI